MTKKIYAVFASLVAVISALALTTPASKASQNKHGAQGHQHTTTRQVRQRATSHVRRRATKVRKKIRQQAVRYICPMHSEIRSQSRGECPKCRMELVAERQGAKS